LDGQIWKLKAEGKSLRQIAVALGISHEAVRKRLKAVKDKHQVSTSNAPCPIITEGVNPLGTLAEQPTEGKKGVSQEVCSKDDDLFGAIKDFLESRGIEVYRMQVAQEAYQVDRNGQIVRFYVQRNK
jgi:hypothetical protein